MKVLFNLSLIAFVFLLSGFGYLSVSKKQQTIKDENRYFAFSQADSSLLFYNTPAEKTFAGSMFARYVSMNNQGLYEKRLAELKKLNTPLQWSERQKEIRNRLDSFFGKFPSKTPLNPRITGRLERDKYFVEKLIFESIPGYYVTANIYIPKNYEFPQPGVLFLCGHSIDGKASVIYQEACQGLVLKGYVVLILDPMGQGERLEYIDAPSGNMQPSAYVFKDPVDQHYYPIGQMFLTGWTMSGLFAWEGIRGIDYLITRPEVDKDRIAVMGNSGGGQMAFLTAAVDERIKVVVAGHPGGPCENTYLTGFHLTDRDVLSLIPPRPCKIIVGRDAGFEPESHRRKLEDMHLFYEGLGYGKELGEIELVDGVHNFAKPKREPAYEWLNKWFSKEEDRHDPSMYPEKPETLWCTLSGSTILSEGSKTVQELCALKAKEMGVPEKNIDLLRKKVAERIHFTLPSSDNVPLSRSSGFISDNGLNVEKLIFESAKGIDIPAVLIKPDIIKKGSPVLIHYSTKGKPVSFAGSSLAFELAKAGYIVFSIDALGSGETAGISLEGIRKYENCFAKNQTYFSQYVRLAEFDNSILGIRALNIVHAIDFLKSRDDLISRDIFIIGEYFGGLCGLLAASFDMRVSGVICINTLPSYRLITGSQYYDYSTWEYCWVPGALFDYDIGDLTRLMSPRPQLWIDPVDAGANKIDKRQSSTYLPEEKNLKILTTKNSSYSEIIKEVNNFIK